MTMVANQNAAKKVLANKQKTTILRTKVPIELAGKVGLRRHAVGCRNIEGGRADGADNGRDGAEQPRAAGLILSEEADRPKRNGHPEKRARNKRHVDGLGAVHAPRNLAVIKRFGRHAQNIPEKSALNNQNSKNASELAI